MQMPMRELKTPPVLANPEASSKTPMTYSLLSADEMEAIDLRQADQSLERLKARLAAQTKPE